jgi:predicted AlkP superfamily pyrophosphatase or phosphodiesterase
VSWNAAAAQDRLLFISLDGLGYQNLTKDPAARELTVLHELAKQQNSIFSALQTSFPSKTAAGHAALFTGAWSGANGIFSNTTPLKGRSTHSLRDTVSGFRSDSLTAEPIWTAAARQGLSVVAYQTTQMYPFNSLSAGKAVAINSYQSRTIAPARAIRQKDLNGSVWKDGPLTFQIERRPEGLFIKCGTESVLAKYVATEAQPPRGRELARHFSAPLFVDVNGVKTGLYFRLFEYSNQDFLLFRTAAQEMAASGLSFDLQKEAGPVVGNAASTIYERGLFGKLLPEGGDGIAERRFLETLELCVRQLSRQSLALDKQIRPKLFVGYFPAIDDAEHKWFGLSATGMTSINAYRAWAYAALDEGLKPLTARFAKDFLIFSSDHGMASTTHEVRIGALLEDLGFAKDTIVANASCLFINTREWKDGIVDQSDKQKVLGVLEEQLRSTGLFSRFYPKIELASKFGLNGENSPDLCFDLAPFYYFSESSRRPAVSRYPQPKGEHGFVPTRADMQSFVLVAGTGLQPSQMDLCQLCLRSIDVAPTVSALLGIAPPRNATGIPLTKSR